MGYSYIGRKLCCDLCPTAGGVRKMPCPFGCCPSIAACANCRKTRKAEFSAEAHRALGCEERMARYAAEDAARESLLAAGKYLRVAALAEPGGRIKVWFRNAAGHERIEYIPEEIYRAVHANHVAALEDFGLC